MIQYDMGATAVYVASFFWRIRVNTYTEIVLDAAKSSGSVFVNNSRNFIKAHTTANLLTLDIF